MRNISLCQVNCAELASGENFAFVAKQSKYTGLKFRALLTVSTESALTKAGNSVLMASEFHGLAVNFGFCACVLHVTRQCMVTRLAQKFGKQSHEIMGSSASRVCVQLRHGTVP